jgi:hypothetical protein
MKPITYFSSSTLLLSYNEKRLKNIQKLHRKGTELFHKASEYYNILYETKR